MIPMISSLLTPSRPVRVLFGALAIGSSLGGVATSAAASTSVATVPVGYLKYEIPGGGVTSTVGIPLDDTSAPPAGIRTGVIESFTSNTIGQSTGGWTANLASASAPWMVRLTSGPSAGKMLDITSNTGTTLTVVGANLTTLGLTAGVDTFELVPMDTLWSVLGSDTVQGGPSAAVADVVQVRSGTAWLAFYYDTGLGFWRRTSGAATNSNNTIVRPGSGMLILRRGGAQTLTFAGRVLGTTFRMPVNNASTTGLTTGFPTDTTLAGLSLQNLLAGWRSGTTTAAADSIGLHNGTTWVPYVYNGSNWQTPAGANSDSVSVPAGTVLLIQRPGSTPGTTDLVRSNSLNL
jgi:hypothetical protein